jgi:hypothetical protein
MRRFARVVSSLVAGISQSGGSTMAGARDKVSKGVQKYLEPGEQIQSAFYAMTGSKSYNDRALVATDRRIIVCSLNFFGGVQGHLADVDRGTQIGPASGAMQYWTESLGPRLGIARRFYKDVEAADAARPDAGS